MLQTPPFSVLFPISFVSQGVCVLNYAEHDSKITSRLGISLPSNSTHFFASSLKEAIPSRDDKHIFTNFPVVLNLVVYRYLVFGYGCLFSCVTLFCIDILFGNCRKLSVFLVSRFRGVGSYRYPRKSLLKLKLTIQHNKTHIIS